MFFLIFYLMSFFLESLKLSSPVLPVHTPWSPRSAYHSATFTPGLVSLDAVDTLWNDHCVHQVCVDDDPLLCHPALVGSSALGTPHPPGQRRLSTPETTSPPQVHGRKMNGLCSAGCDCVQISLYIHIYCLYLCLCVCVRSCHTFSGEEGVSGVVAWTGGFAERSPETRLFWGLNFFWWIKKILLNTVKNHILI